MEDSSNWFPGVHPILVHFPIALLFVAFVIELTGFVFKKYEQAGFIADILIWIGTIFGICAVISGLMIAGSLNLSGELKSEVDSHSLMGKITIAFFILYSIVRIFRYRNRGKLKPTMVLAIILLGAIGLFGIYITGDKGAQLVYKYGIGLSKK